MTAVKCRNRNEVHHAEHYRKQGRNVEEDVPVPVRREDLSDGDEASYRLVCLCLRSKHQLEVLEVAANGCEGLLETGRDGSKESVLFC